MSRSNRQHEGLFSQLDRPGRRVVVTGQVGLDKTPFLQQVIDLAARHGHQARLLNVGQMMYAEAPDVGPGRILDLSLARLNSLRRAVFKEILEAARTCPNVIVNTHATFRWRHGVFAAFDHDQMSQLDADLYVTLVDNVDTIHECIDREHTIDHSLKDLLVWREEEILATEVLAKAIRGYGCFHVLAKGQDAQPVETLYRLIFEPHRKKIYVSFPMTHVFGLASVMARIEQFRSVLAEHFIVFDPAQLEEKRLLVDAGNAKTDGRDHITVRVNGRDIHFTVDELLSVAGDIDGQIYARDFKLIEQADMIVSFVPELPGGRPGLSSGVERELQHAFESAKDVYVVWQPKSEPSPFITETATRVFTDLGALLAYFQHQGLVGDYQLPLSTPEADAP